MKIIFLASLMMILTATITTFSQEDKEKWFAIYLLPDNIKSNQLSKINLKKLKPFGNPFIHQNDISFYNQDTHEFRISNYRIGEKFQKAKMTGKTFAVFVGDEAIFVGAFWSSILSSSFNGTFINLYGVDKEFPILKFETGYPTSKYFTGNDLRADSRMLKAFEKVGKLFDDFEVIAKCKNIKATGKRHASFIFTFEVVEIINGKFDQNEVQFELFMDFGGGKILHDLEKKTLQPYDDVEHDFDANKEFILKFQKRVGRPDAKYHWLKENDYGLKTWEVKK